MMRNVTKFFFKYFIDWRNFLVFILSLFCFTRAFADDHTVNLTVAYKWVNYTGKRQQAIAVNDQIPGPVLHFKEGDHLTINVYNHLNKDTVIHWHGLLVPWQMDGVEGITQKGISSGEVSHYHFTLNQAGTYWYHAHAGLQEQQGLYGAFIIDPLKPPLYKYSKDYTVVLSDWSNTAPEKILANLKKDGDYYSPKLPLQSSLVHFITTYRQAKTPDARQKIIDDYKMMQQMRMSIYDISDVAYDAFLLNGQANAHPWTAPIKVGDVVRLRFIDAGASTNFRVKITGTPMKIVQIEGNDVKPYTVNDFFITPGETYDVLVKIQKNQPYIIYAESADTIGAAYGALIPSLQQTVNYKSVTPFPEPQPVTREMMANMMPGMENGSMSHDTMSMGSMKPGMQMSANSMKSTHINSGERMPENMPMNHSMDMPTEAIIVGDKTSPIKDISSTTTGTKYQNLIAAVKTNDPNKPVSGTIRMELFGYMDHFIWMINGLPGYEVHPIIFEPGKRYQIIFTNNSMMHHPMHIHGHWFILRNGHGAYDPLLHTIDVPPGATVVADIDADASGQWLFHCHHLYHMMTGMARVFQYETIINVAKGTSKPESIIEKTPYINRPILREDETMAIDSSLVNHPMAHPAGLYFSNFLDVGADFFNNTQRVTFKGLYGSDYNKLELFSNDAELKKGAVNNAGMDIFYWHLISQFWAIKGGANYIYRPGNPYWQPGIGIEGLMPYFIDTDVKTYYHDGSTKLDVELSRDTQITNNSFIRVGVRSILATKTIPQDEIGSGLNQVRYIIRPYYRVTPGVSLFTEYEHESNYGSLSKMLQSAGEKTSKNTFTFGIAVLF